MRATRAWIPDPLAIAQPAAVPDSAPGSAAGARDDQVVLIGGTRSVRDAAAGAVAAAGMEFVHVETWAQASSCHPSAFLVGADSPPHRHPAQAEVIFVGMEADANAVWAAAARAGAHRVAIFPYAAGWLVEFLMERRDRQASGFVLGVIGGSGASGATTLSCWLADRAAERASVILIDADRGAGGIDMALDLADIPGVRWDDLRAVQGVLNSAQFAQALPGTDRFAVLSHRAQEYDREYFPTVSGSVMDAARNGFDLSVIDVGREREDSPFLAVCDALVLLVRARPRALDAARGVLARLEGMPTRIVMRGGPGSILDEVQVASMLNVGGGVLYLPEVKNVVLAEEQGRLVDVGRHKAPSRLCAAVLEEIPLVRTERPGGEPLRPRTRRAKG